MNRLAGDGFREAIGAAYALLRPRLSDRLQHVHFFTGSDPWRAGLHEGSPEVRAFADGTSYSYAEMAFCMYPHHQRHLSASARRTTIVLPPTFFRDYGWCAAETVIHELGHALHEVIGWDWVAEPVTAYAHENNHEAFAEAFAAWVTASQRAPLVDEATRALFERLAA